MTFALVANAALDPVAVGYLLIILVVWFGSIIRAARNARRARLATQPARPSTAAPARTTAAVTPSPFASSPATATVTVRPARYTMRPAASAAAQARALQSAPSARLASTPQPPASPMPSISDVSSDATAGISGAAGLPSAQLADATAAFGTPTSLEPASAASARGWLTALFASPHGVALGVVAGAIIGPCAAARPFDYEPAGW